MDKKIKNHLKQKDPILYSWILKIELEEHKPSEDLFTALCEDIISQQLSGKAADTIFGRFIKLFPRQKVIPQALLRLSDEKIRSCGTSWAKIKSLKDLAHKVSSKELDLDHLKNLSDDKIIHELIKVKGIGPWTAEMFLMFSLGREDVFSHGDLGLRNGIKKVYGFKKDPTKKQIDTIVKKWSPYRTYASRILWKSLLLQ